MNSKADSVQIGGDHYKNTPSQHWNLVITTRMGYFEGQITRYISRWRKKDGIQDLQKALHYIYKLIEVNNGGMRMGGGIGSLSMRTEVTKFIAANSLSNIEGQAIMEVVCWRDEGHLMLARDLVIQLSEEAEPKPVPVEDSNKHADRGKCLISEGCAVCGKTMVDCRYPNCDCERVYNEV